MGLIRKGYRQWVRRSRRYWKESEFLPLVRDHMELDHPDLDADGVRKLNGDARLPFYWQVWRWVLRGNLTTWNSREWFDRRGSSLR